MKSSVFLTLFAVPAFALPLNQVVGCSENKVKDEIKIVQIKEPTPQKKGISKLEFFPNEVKLVGQYTLKDVLTILANAGINVEILDNIGNPTLILSLETASIKEFLKTVCTQANIWCDYDPIRRKAVIRKYKKFVVEFTPEGKNVFSLGQTSNENGGGSGGGNGGEGGNAGGGSSSGQTFGYYIENVSATEFINLIKQYFPQAKIYASQQGYIMFRADPRTYREIVEFFKEREEREERVYVEVDLIRIDLKHQYQWGIDWSGLTDIGDIGKLKHLTWHLTFNPIATGDMGAIGLATDMDTKALFTWLSQYGRVFKVDGYYAQTKTGTPLPFRNYKLIRYFTITAEQGQNGNVEPKVEINTDEVGFRGVITVYKRKHGPYKYYVDGVVDLSAVADWITLAFNGNEIKAPEIQGQTFKIATPLQSLYSTIIVGGFRSKGFTGQDKGTPYLDEMPGINWLFKGKEDMRETSEFLVVVHLEPAGEEIGNKVWIEEVGEEISNEP
jgi:hypothetical protein